MKKLFTLSIIAGLLVGTLQLSCKKFVQIPAPETKAEQEKIFTNDQTATSAVAGVYTSMTSGNGFIFNGGITAYTAIYADELSSPVTNATTEPFRSNTLLAADETISSMWLLAYRSLYQANACLEGLEQSISLSTNTKRQLEGEMYYIRAFMYFNLVNLFGDVPLATGTDYVVNSKMPRTKTSVVYDQIIADLQKASALFADIPAQANTRPGRLAASALLAKVYLFLGNYEQARLLATEVIQSGKYSLELVSNTFLATSKETIMQLSKSNGNVSEASTFIPATATGKPNYTLMPELLAVFETGDTRRTNWVRTATSSGVTYYSPFKYKTRATTPITEFLILQRLAEVYLIRAEARANQGDLPGAIDDLDMVRKRAGLLLVKSTNPSISQSALVTAILKERQVELYAEWGNRWFDLKRTGRADAVLGAVKATNWQPTDKLFPIPSYERQSNPYLTQNEGY